MFSGKVTAVLIYWSIKVRLGQVKSTKRNEKVAHFASRKRTLGSPSYMFSKAGEKCYMTCNLVRDH